MTTRPKLHGLVSRVKLVGIELEGGWDQAPEGEALVRDGSVKFPPIIDVESPRYKGEVVSVPLPVDNFARWVQHAYPKYVNETCGLHIHMSFHYRINYARLMVPAFTGYMVGVIRAWAEQEDLPRNHSQWNRLHPTHPWTLQHCAHIYLGEGQVRMTRKDFESRGTPYSRYTFINYCDGQHHTIEVRGLSMPETPEVAIRAIIAVVDGTNRFLSKIKHREKPEHATIKERPESVQEFRSYSMAA